MWDAAVEARDAVITGLRYPSVHVWFVLGERFNSALPGLLSDALQGISLCHSCARTVAVGVAKSCKPICRKGHFQTLTDVVSVLSRASAASAGGSRIHPYELAWAVVDASLRDTGTDHLQAPEGGHEAAARVASALCKSFDGLRAWLASSDPRMPPVLAQRHVSFPEAQGEDDECLTDRVMRLLRAQQWAEAFDELAYAYVLDIEEVDAARLGLEGTPLFDLLQTVCLDMAASTRFAEYLIATDNGERGTVRRLEKYCTWSQAWGQSAQIPSVVTVSTDKLDKGPVVAVLGVRAGSAAQGDVAGPQAEGAGSGLVEVVLPSYHRVMLPPCALADVSSSSPTHDAPVRIRVIWTYDALMNTINETRRSLDRVERSKELQGFYKRHPAAAYDTPLPESFGLGATISKLEYERAVQQPLFAVSTVGRGSVQGEWLQVAVRAGQGSHMYITVPSQAVEYVPDTAQCFVLAFLAAVRGYVSAATATTLSTLQALLCVPQPARDEEGSGCAAGKAPPAVPQQDPGGARLPRHAGPLPLPEGLTPPPHQRHAARRA